MRIVFASHSHFSPCMVVGSHHLARRLAGAGHEVFHLSSPLTPVHLTRLGRSPCRERFHAWLRGPRQIAPRLTGYIPLALVPWQIARRSLTPSSNLFAESMVAFEATVRRRGFAAPDLLLVDEPRLAGIQRLLRPERTYYRATDLYSDFQRDPAVKNAERILAAEADGVIGTSGPVVEWLRALAPGLPSLLLENGVDYAHFSAPRPCPLEYRGLKGPRVIYMGVVDQRFDFLALRALAEARPDVTFLLAGPVSTPIPAALRARGNVVALGPRRYEDMPAYLQHADAGLLPFNSHSANRGRSPMKLYEYASAGLPVVSAATEEIVRRAEPFVFTYPAPAAAPEALEAALSTGGAALKAREAARTRDWGRIAEELLVFAAGKEARQPVLI